MTSQKFFILYNMAKETTTDEDKIAIISENFAKIMETLGMDLNDASLKDTPKRVAKMYVQEIFRSLTDKTPPTFTDFDNGTNDYDQIVIVQNVELTSTCEHHFMPIIGKVHIGYIPADKVIGLSKINRAVDYVGRKPQIQERIVRELYELLSPIMGDDIIIIADAVHHCVCTRGPKDKSSSTVNSFAGGRFRTDKSIKDEFYNLLRSKA